MKDPGSLVIRAASIPCASNSDMKPKSAGMGADPWVDRGDMSPILFKVVETPCVLSPLLLGYIY